VKLPAPSFKKKLALNVFKKYVGVQTSLHELSYFFWECTSRCNVACLHCGSDCRMDEHPDMPAEDFLRVTKQVSEHYDPHKVMIVITGGEPLLRKDLAEVGKELYNQGFPWGFVTNGYALTPERFRSLIDSGLRSVTVSLDGFESSHNWLRGNPKSFAKAVDAIKLLIAEPGLVYDVVTCINQRNFSEIPQMKQFLTELGVKRWRIFTICPIGRARNNPELHIDQEQFVWLMDFLKEGRKEGLIKMSYGCEDYLGDYETEVRDGFYFCRAGVNIASVLADGSINACPNINRAYNQGNIYKDDFMEVWNNRFESFRDREWMRNGICSDCKQFKWCRGNGMHLRDPETGETLRCHNEFN
jgi:radical SAM enzyme (rSAM/lipoprotein system)